MNGTRNPRTCKHCGEEYSDGGYAYCTVACRRKAGLLRAGYTPRLSLEERFWKYTQVGGSDECWIWTGPKTPAGYGHLSAGHRGVVARAHRMSYEMKWGPLPDGAHVLHSCDTPSCVNPAHLRHGSHEENMQDMAKRERGSKTKLTAADVSKIRIALRAGATGKSLARKYGVVPSTIYYIRTGDTWKHVK